VDNFEFHNMQLDGVNAPSVVISVTWMPPTEGETVIAVLDFDSSASMADSDPGAVGRKAAGLAFFAITMDGDDEVAIIDFGPPPDNGLVASRLLQDFTTNTTLLEQALDLLTDYNGTPLWESILDGLGLLADHLGTGGALVVMTDGYATPDHNFGLAKDTAIQQGVAVYTVGMGEDVDEELLREIATATGGLFVYASDAEVLEQAFANIGTVATQGYYRVDGTATFALQPPGEYILSGQLVVTFNDSAWTLPFSIPVEIVGD
jgi:hypothetical protein